MANGNLTLEAGTLRGLLNKSGIVELREIGLQTGVASSTTWEKEDLVNKIVEKLAAQKRPINSTYYEATDYDVNELLKCYLNEKDYRPKEIEGYLDEYVYGAMVRNSELKTEKDMIFIPRWVMEKFDLRGGDYIKGTACLLSMNSVYGVIEVKEVNGLEPLTERKNYIDLRASQIKKKLVLGMPEPLDAVDVLTPVGEGMKTIIRTDLRGNALSKLLTYIPESFEQQGIKTYSLFLGESPEFKNEVVNIKDNLFYTNFEENVEENYRMFSLIIDIAKREVEMGQRVAVLLSRLESVYTGDNFCKIRSLFGSSKYTKSGSLTIITTARRDFNIEDIADNVMYVNYHNGSVFYDYLKSYSSLKNKE